MERRNQILVEINWFVCWSSGWFKRINRYNLFGVPRRAQSGRSSHLSESNRIRRAPEIRSRSRYEYNLFSIYAITFAETQCDCLEIKETRSPFLFLAIDLPPIPVFQDSTERNNIIPQVPISTVLAKFNGQTTQETAGRLRRYKLTRLPPFIVFTIKRFTSNNFVEEKNPTIINFPLKGIDLQECRSRHVLHDTCACWFVWL